MTTTPAIQPSGVFNSPAFQRANDVFLAPFIVFPNLGFSALNAAVGGAAAVAERSARAAGAVPLAGAVEQASGRLAEQALGTARASANLAARGARRAVGGGAADDGAVTANQLLADTVLDQGTATALLPARAALDAAAATLEVPPVQRAAVFYGRQLSRLLDAFSSQGAIPGAIGADTSARVRLAFRDLSTNGPTGAVARDFRGIVGGLAALMLGDFQRLEQGAIGFQGSMEYVFDKKLNGEVQPEVDFPIGARLAAIASEIIERFPWGFVRALGTRDPVEVLRAYLRNPGQVNTLFGRYPGATFNVLGDVLVYIAAAIFDTPAAQTYALNELYVMESRLSDEGKDWSLGILRETTPLTGVEYEFYVPLVVPLGGTFRDKAFRHNAAGEIIPDHTVAPSVFDQTAIDIAQAVNAELLTLRSFVWLYRDEAVARQKAYQATVRKFGREAARRVQANPRYPLTPEDVQALTGGLPPRSRQEVDAIQDTLMRQRGVLNVADSIKLGYVVP